VAIAKERGVRLRFEGAPASGAYRRAVKVVASGAGPTTEVAGTVLGDQPRIVAIDGYPIEIRPRGDDAHLHQLRPARGDRQGRHGARRRRGEHLGMQLSRVARTAWRCSRSRSTRCRPSRSSSCSAGLGDVIHSLRIARL
jgi:hypothetical protein